MARQACGALTTVFQIRPGAPSQTSFPGSCTGIKAVKALLRLQTPHAQRIRRHLPTRLWDGEGALTIAQAAQRAGYCIMVHNEWDGEDGVKALIAQGPEPLESQFGPGYGMALNLLRTRTLPQAADFVQKSFSLYLGELCLVKLLRVDLYMGLVFCSPQNGRPHRRLPILLAASCPDEPACCMACLLMSAAWF